MMASDEWKERDARAAPENTADDFEDLFSGEPTPLEEHFPQIYQDDPQESSYQPKSLAEEMRELYGSHAPVHAFDGYLDILEDEKSHGQGGEHLEPPKEQEMDRDSDWHNESIGSLFVPPLEDVRQSTPAKGSTSIRTGSGRKLDNGKQYDNHVFEPSTPTESELAEMDFQLQKAVEKVKSKHVRDALHEADPSLSRRELFRIYRKAIRKSVSTSVEQSLIRDQGVEIDSDTIAGNTGKGFMSDASPCSDGDERSGALKSRSFSTTRFTTKRHSHEEDRGEQRIQDAASARHSSLMHSRPYLSDPSPADIQGHHPTCIPKSPHRDRSRSSSLAAETLPDLPTTNEEPQQLTETALAAKNRSNGMEARTDLPAPAAKMRPLSPFRRPTEPASYTSPGRSSPLRKHLDSMDTASTKALIGSPAPDPAQIPSRPDTPRPSFAGQLNGDVNPSSMGTPLLALTHERPRTPASHGSRTFSAPDADIDDDIDLDHSPSKPPFAMSVHPSSPPQYRELRTTLSDAKQPNRRSVSTQSDLCASNIDPRTSAMLQPIPSLAEPWQEPSRATDVLSRPPGRSPSPLGPSVGRYPRTSPKKHHDSLAKKLSDQFASGLDVIHFEPLQSAPDPSPSPDFLGEIRQAKRKQRSTTASPRKQRSATAHPAVNRPSPPKVPEAASEHVNASDQSEPNSRRPALKSGRKVSRSRTKIARPRAATGTATSRGRKVLKTPPVRSVSKRPAVPVRPVSGMSDVDMDADLELPEIQVDEPNENDVVPDQDHVGGEPDEPISSIEISPESMTPRSKKSPAQKGTAKSTTTPQRNGVRKKSAAKHPPTQRRTSRAARSKSVQSALDREDLPDYEDVPEVPPLPTDNTEGQTADLSTPVRRRAAAPKPPRSRKEPATITHLTPESAEGKRERGKGKKKAEATPTRRSPRIASKAELNNSDE